MTPGEGEVGGAGGGEGGPEGGSEGGRIRREGQSHWAGEPVRVLEQRWSVPFLEAHEVLGSTNDRIRVLADAGAPPFTMVVAEEQTAGRGRGGSTWISPAGKGIWMSVLLPGEGRGRPPLAPLLVGVAVSRALGEGELPIRPGIKWPNDVEISGRKVCGILCEGTAGGKTVAGIGINVAGGRERFPPEFRERATTLEAEVEGGVPPRPDLVGRILHHLRVLTDPIPDALEGDLAAELRALDVLRGRRISVSGGLVGRGRGIDADGALLVVPEGESNVKRVVAGSVRRTSKGEPCSS